MFKNLRFYRVTSPWPQSEQELSDALSENMFSPCGAYAERSAGWESPVGMPADLLCRRLNGADLIQLRTQSRVLPVAAVRDALDERLIEFRERMSVEPNRSELRRLKEETHDKLLPDALVKSDRNRACFLHSESILIIDAGTENKAEWFFDQLRPCFPEFGYVPLTYSTPPGDLLQRIFMGDSPLGFSLGRECRMQDEGNSKSRVSWFDFELTDASIRRHVTDGMKLTHLGVGFDEVMSCVIDDQAIISKVKFIGSELIDSFGSDDPVARLDADFVLLTGAMRRLIEDLKQLLGGFASTQPN